MNHKRNSWRPKYGTRFTKLPSTPPFQTKKKLKEMKKTKNQNFISLLFKIIKKKILRNLSPRRSCTYSNHYFYYFLLGYLCIIWAMPLSVRNHLVQTRGDRDLRLQSFVSVLWAICFLYFELNRNKIRI